MSEEIAERQCQQMLRMGKKATEVALKGCFYGVKKAMELLQKGKSYAKDFVDTVTKSKNPFNAAKKLIDNEIGELNNLIDKFECEGHITGVEAKDMRDMIKNLGDMEKCDTVVDASNRYSSLRMMKEDFQQNQLDFTKGDISALKNLGPISKDYQMIYKAQTVGAKYMPKTKEGLVAQAKFKSGKDVFIKALNKTIQKTTREAVHDKVRERT